MNKRFLIVLVIGAPLLLLFFYIFFITEEDKEQSIVLKKDNAKELDVELNLGIGKLNVQKGTTEWIEGNAIYNVKKLKPIIDYDLHRGKGEAVIEHKDQNRFKFSKIKNEWQLNLTDEIPIKLSIETGAAMANLNLQGLKLIELDIETGIGDLTVDLRGDWEKSFETNIETGIGQTTVYLPSDVGVEITIEKGIGFSNVVGFISQGDGVYVNEAFENADVILTVTTEMGIGNVSFKVEQ